MVYRFGPFLLDSQQRILKSEGQLVALTPKAIDLLLLLIERAGRIVTKDEICEIVWQGVFIDDSSIAKNISILRRILRPQLGDTDPIRTISKRGYEFVHPVTFGSSGETSTYIPNPPASSLPTASSAEETPLIVPVGKFAWKAWAAIVMILIGTTAVGSVGYTRWQTQRHPRQRTCLIVLDFKNLSDNTESDWLSTALPEAIRLDAQRGEDIRFVSGDRIAQSLRELNIGNAIAYTRGTLENVRHDLDCNEVLTGSYISADNRLRLDLQLQDAATGTSLGTFSKTDQQHNLFAMASDAANAVRKQLSLPVLKPFQTAQQVAPGTEGSLRLYAEGLQLLRAGEVPEAQLRLSAAVAANPESPIAHITLAQAWSQMGFDTKAVQETKLALDRSASLSREEKLLTMATYQSLVTPHSTAAYAELARAYPNEVDYSIDLARSQTNVDKAKDALSTLNAVLVRDPESRSNPRIDLAKAEAYKALNDYRGELIASGDAIQQSRARSAKFLETQALLLEGSAWMKLGNANRARDDFETAEQISASLQDNVGLAEALTYEGELFMHNGNGDSEPLLHRALDIEHDIGARRAMISTLNDLASRARSDANMFAARELYLQTLDIARETEDRTAEANALLSLGNVSLNTGDPDSAITYYNQAREIATAIQNRRLEAISMGNAANVAFAQGDLTGALKQQQQVLAIKQTLGDAASTAVTLDYLTTLEIAAGNLKSARDYADQQTHVLHASGTDQLRDQINYSIISMEEGNPTYAETPMTKLAAISSKPSPGAEALRVLGLSWLARGDIAKAREASERDIALARTSPNIADYLIPASIAAARIDIADDHAAKAHKALQALLNDAVRIKNMRLQLEIRLLIAEAEYREGKTSEGTRQLQLVCEDASRRGFGLIAHEATKYTYLRRATK